MEKNIKYITSNKVRGSIGEDGVGNKVAKGDSVAVFSYSKPSSKQRLETKILNQSMSELMRLNDHFKAKKERRQNIRDINEAKRLKNENLYHHEYERIKNYLDTTTVDPVEAGRLESRKKDIMAMAGERKKTKYDELLNGK